MSELVGLLSSPMLSKEPTTERYNRWAYTFKRAAVLCDYVFLDTQYLPLPGSQQDKWIYDVVGETESSLLRESKEFKRLLLRPQDLGDERQIFSELWSREGSFNDDNIGSKAYEVVKEMVGEYPSLKDEYKLQGELIGLLVHDMRMPLVCQQWFPDASAILSPLHRRMLAKLIPRVDPNDNQAALTQLEASNIIDFGTLTWEQVLSLRRSTFWTDFRARLDSISSDRTDAISAVWKDLWAFADDNMPHVGRASILALANTFPLPGAAILGLASSANELAHTMRVRERFGWLYFLMQANPSLKKQQRDE